MFADSKSEPLEESTATTARPEESLWMRPLRGWQIGVGLAAGLLIIGWVSLRYYLENSWDPYGPVTGTPAFAAEPPSAGLPMGEDDFSLIPREEIHAGGPSKDGIPALTDPKVTSGREVTRMRPGDRIIGIDINGEARAYPLRILNWHEIVNDTVGGQAVAVTYCPLCDSALVFNREIGGQVREFGVSGLLYNSNVLMYDRQKEDSKESLWSQMLMKAVVGPAAEQGLELELLPAQLVPWGEWQREHPQTTVLSFDTGHGRNYDHSPYEDYFATDRIMFPVLPVAQVESSESLPGKEPLIIVAVDGKLKGYPVTRLDAAAGANGEVRDEFNGRTIRFVRAGDDGRHDRVADEAGKPLPTAFSFWFEFQAMHPGAEVFRTTN